MNFSERVTAAIESFRNPLRTIPGAVSASEARQGHDDSTFGPEMYGDYLVTSNAVYACSTLRADTLSGIPLKAYRMSGGKRVEVVDGPVTQLLRKVNPFWTMNRLLTMTELSLCLWGRCFWAVERAPAKAGGVSRGEPREIWWMKPTQVTVYPDANKYVRGFSYQPVDGGDPIPWEPSEIIWFRFPNPLDEFGGLSPIAAARLAADMGNNASRSNQNLFLNGYQPGGIVMPLNSMTWTPEQAKELEGGLDRRFKGKDKAHRWGVMRNEVKIWQAGVTPKDAEFLGSLAWSLEEVARAYKVPLDMVGGQRTYENVQAAERAFWYRTMEPESRFIASELVEQLLPMFPKGTADLVEFDLSKVPILQDAESEIWMREKEQIASGAIVINEWRVGKGLEKVAWGDVWWAPGTVMPIEDATVAEATPAPQENDQESQTAETQSTQSQSGGNQENLTAKAPAEDRAGLRQRAQRKPLGDLRAVEYEGEEHQRLWRAFVRRTDRHEKELSRVVVELFKRQRDAVVAKVKDGNTETLKKPEASAKVQAELRLRGNRASVADEPFNLKEWIRKFREGVRKSIRDITDDAGQEALDGLGVAVAFNVKNPAVARFIERRAQRFAREVNETTWKLLKGSLSEGMDAGETILQLMDRVEEVMSGRIESTPEVIARTEVIGAYNGGTLEGWEQSGLNLRKSWLAALDDRTRDSHVEAHQTYQAEPIPLDEDFILEGGSGPAPGQIGVAEEDINCRCTMTADVMEEE